MLPILRIINESSSSSLTPIPKGASRGGHRSQTSLRKAFLFGDSLVISPHYSPINLASLSTSLPQILGLPRFLLPWGFHVKACRVILLSYFLSVCPIHLNSLSVMSSCPGLCLVLLHSSSLEIRSGKEFSDFF